VERERVHAEQGSHGEQQEAHIHSSGREHAP
jgi:hypothetical protein